MNELDLVEILRKTPNLCGGGQLYAIVYCCGLQKPCPIRDKALEMLGITKDEYAMVKEKHRIAHEGVCFKNLAYCCSLLKPCIARGKAMKELEITATDYLKYKAEMLKEFMRIARNKSKEVWEERIMRPLIFLVLDPEKGIEWKGIAIGNLDISPSLFFINEIKARRRVNLKRVAKS